MSIELPRMWVPSTETLKTINPNPTIEYPETGVNDNVRLAEMFINTPTNVREQLQVIGSNLTDEELFANLTSFYSPTTQTGVFYTLNTLYGGGNKKFTDKMVEALWLYNHYKPGQVLPIIKLVDQLRQNISTRLTENTIIPTYKELDQFLDMMNWFEYQNFHAPIEFTWVVSQEWTQQEVQEILTITNGDLTKILPLLNMGADTEFIKSQLNNETPAIPDYWLQIFEEAMNNTTNPTEND